MYVVSSAASCTRDFMQWQQAAQLHAIVHLVLVRTRIHVALASV